MEITTTTEMEKQPSSVTMQLLSRIDFLETAMRRLEMKQCSYSSGCSSSTANHTSFSPTSGVTSDHQQLPLFGLDLETALKETSFKGTLLERIKTLENRLFQLRLRVESDKQEARSRKDQLSSSPFPVFMMNQSSEAYKKRVSTPNICKLNNYNFESQTKENDEIIRCKEDEEKSRQQKLSKKNSKKKNRKPENGDRERRGRMNMKKKPMSEAEKEKIKSHNWPRLRFLGC